MNKRLIEKLAQALRDNGFSTSSQILCLAEEAGEFVGAYRRYAGLARRNGTFEDLAAELADVVIAAHVVAEFLNINLEQAVSDKLEVVFNRGWRND